MTQPVILGIDTSGHHCVVALMRPDGSIASLTEEMSKGQAERLMPMAQKLLDSENLTWADLTALAVGIGPGNFTGIRIAVSAVRGLSLALGIPAIGISNFELKHGERPATDGQCWVHLPAPRGYRYSQRFTDGAPSQAAVHEPVDPDDPTPAQVNLMVVPERLLRIAANKLPLWQGSAPAPLYVKAPDAAPARDTAPALIQ